MAAKKYTVKEFCKKYNDTNVEQTKEALIKSIMNNHYVSYEKKITICQNIINQTYYREIEKDKYNKKELYVNSPMKYMFYCLYLIKEYTYLEVKFSDCLEEFNLLNKGDLLDIIYNNIYDKELKEFQMILNMVENDVLQNEYETHAFISNQVKRFGELFGHIVTPMIDKLNDSLKNIDEKTINEIVNNFKSLNELKDKFNVSK